MINNKYKTPTYIYYSSRIDKNIKLFNKCVEKGILVLYAIKANNHKPIVKSFIKAGFGFDIASREELDYLIKLRADTRKISFSAPTKMVEDITYAYKKGVRYFAFDSIPELQKILENAPEAKLIARISVRNRNAQFDLSDTFGFDTDNYIKMVDLLQESENKLHGITFHVGSQNTSLNSWKYAIKIVSKLIEETVKKGIQIKCINMGGGFPVKYNPEDPETHAILERSCEMALKLKEKYALEEIIIEPGRALVANSMDLISKVVNIKDYMNPKVLVLDMSVFNGLIEPLEHFEYPVFKLENNPSGAQHEDYYKITGISCDGYDIINQKCALPSDIKIGDLVVIPNVGAYSFVYKEFHMRKYPKIIQN